MLFELDCTREDDDTFLIEAVSLDAIADALPGIKYSAWAAQSQDQDRTGVFVLPEDAEALREAILDKQPDRSPWMICGQCNGNGKHSLAIGAITQEDRERDWDPEEFQAYMDGAYDRTCEVCGGLGRIREQAWAKFCEADQERRSEDRELRYY